MSSSSKEFAFKTEAQEENSVFKGFVKIIKSLPKGILEASFLLSEDSDFSVNGLLPGAFQESHSLGMLPVKIKRGK